MAKTAACPSCGAPVTFRSVVSITAVCDYCQSTLVRDGDDLDDIGKMAALLEDRSPLQRGSEGRWNGRHFGLIGRLQLKYDAGHWNEWHLLFDDGKSGWLSEAGGEFVISEPARVEEDLPKRAALVIGEAVTLGGRSLTVTNILDAECVAGEGELPFKVGPGYPAPVVDLRDTAGRFATLDYSEDADHPEARPLVFFGELIELAALGMSNLREATPLPEINTRARSFQCPSCGGALSTSGDDILSVGCGTCGAIVDTAHDVVKMLTKRKAAHKVKPLLSIGAKGSLRGEALEIIGYMRRKMLDGGVAYYWWEYVLLAPDRSLRWLTEYTGHWNLARVQTKAVAKLGDKVKSGGDDYKHFQSYVATVDFVVGEFPWRVKADESAKIEDYIAPPKMLSRETTPNEETWTLAEYLATDEVAAAFSPGKALSPPVGVFANQVNPKERRHKMVCRSFWLFFLATWVVQIGLLMVHPGPLVKEPVQYTFDTDEPLLSKDFSLPSGAERLEVIHDASMSNNWVGLHLSLVNKTTGQTWEVDRQISYYEGVDGGESWSEGSRNDEIVFTDLPPGTYVLAADPEMDPTAPAITAQLEIQPSGPRWSSLIMLLVLLSIFPIWTRISKGSFEVERWADSDHPIGNSGSDDDD